MSQNLDTELEQVEKKLEQAIRERDVWKSSKGGSSNFKISEHLVRALINERNSIINEINNQKN